MTAAATPTVADPTPLISLDTSADYSLVARELAASADTLKKMATKVEGAGYHKEARHIRGDADQLLERIVPRFKSQTSLELDSDTLEIDDVIARHFLADIRVTCQAVARQAREQGKTDQPPTDGSDMESMVTKLAQKLALRVVDYGTECAERGLWAGEVAREITQGDVVRRATDKLKPAE